MNYFASAKTLRLAKTAAPFVAVALLAALAAWMWFRRGRKERFSKFSAGVVKDGTRVCPRGWKVTKPSKKYPDRFCEKNKYSAFSDMVDGKCPKGYSRNGKEPEDSDRACRRKEGDRFFEGGKNAKSSTADAGCTNPDFPAKGKRDDRTGQCCQAPWSKRCDGGGGGGSSPASSPASGGGNSKSEGCNYYDTDKHHVMDCKTIASGERNVSGYSCFVEDYNGRQYRKCEKKAGSAPSTPAPAPAPAAEEFGCNTDGTQDYNVRWDPSRGICMQLKKEYSFKAVSKMGDTNDEAYKRLLKHEQTTFGKCKCAEGVNENGNCKNKGKCA
jgi:hypothetical protein